MKLERTSIEKKKNFFFARVVAKDISFMINLCNSINNDFQMCHFQ